MNAQFHDLRKSVKCLLQIVGKGLSSTSDRRDVPTQVLRKLVDSMLQICTFCNKSLIIIICCTDGKLLHISKKYNFLRSMILHDLLRASKSFQIIFYVEWGPFPTFTIKIEKFSYSTPFFDHAAI